MLKNVKYVQLFKKKYVNKLKKFVKF